ncbi:TetR/AcrR family transcriptional regulator [Nonomuraea sp. KC401]|uniref:TetR/AcrR family transcriptional regulator n=1 Tax=unclassified Nonomuraea TaxID=2593643 RepID=UPI0010FE448A|nr:MULTISPECIES: TetR/AcrR family transcriptional regulator [unclassified Nonomuraea]NBF00079.1 TetR family transcriptional regulator [Nonomuraea sp. K271]TLF54310.1 TetR/AcrR family transcriptional regulator [Nonomuraea sp. KC401]
MSTARARWLNEGLKVLAEEGAAGIRIDRIAARLNLSKGSFHHHFDGAEGYKKALLAYFEHLSIEMFENAISEVGESAGARVILARLTKLVRPGGTGLYRPEIDVALRAWATWDADVRAVQTRLDEARLSALQRVWRSAVASDEEARTAALLPYLLAVGATVVFPPVDADQLHDLYEILLPLVPDSSSQTRDDTTPPP